ncbi:MAG: prepilin-type N-terminal cleavage/methylation domain-containing protein [Phycisphaerales bacterium]|nr:prepilin-type N-terminal cleavage/methylation domain-containing protein [Phycisphaerales bacterium]
MRNRRNTNVRNAFTLIEILIVVVILGILAAIVVPQFTNAADDANDASVRSQLQTLRSQVELYRAQNPTNNAVGADGSPVWTNLIDGDYLTAAPINPLTGNATIGTAAAANGSVGWVWRVKTGGSLSYSLYAADPSEASPFEFVE